MDRLRKLSDLQFAFAIVGVIAMVIQNELAWVWNTSVGYGSYCVKALDPACDARLQAQFFPQNAGIATLNAIRGFISFTTALCIMYTYSYYEDLVRARARRLRCPLGAARARALAGSACARARRAPPRLTPRRCGALQVAFKQAKNLLPARSSVFSSSLALPFVLEVTLLLIHSFPGINKVSNNPSFYLAFNVIMFLRLAFTARIVKYHSTLYSSNGRFIG